MNKVRQILLGVAVTFSVLCVTTIGVLDKAFASAITIESGCNPGGWCGLFYFNSNENIGYNINGVCGDMGANGCACNLENGGWYQDEEGIFCS